MLTDRGQYRRACTVVAGLEADIKSQRAAGLDPAPELLARARAGAEEIIAFELCHAEPAARLPRPNRTTRHAPYCETEYAAGISRQVLMLLARAERTAERLDRRAAAREMKA